MRGKVWRTVAVYVWHVGGEEGRGGQQAYLPYLTTCSHD